MSIYYAGNGWTKDGDIVIDGNNNAHTLTDSELFLNILLTHLLTAPGSYKYDTSLGIGILSKFIGQINNSATIADITKSINHYFQKCPTFIDYSIAISTVTKDIDSIELQLQVIGPNIDFTEASLLLDIANGRILESYNFDPEVVEEIISTVETQNGEEVNPYLSRMRGK